MFYGYLYAHNFLFQNDLNLIITHSEACKDNIRGVDGIPTTMSFHYTRLHIINYE